MTAQVLLAQTQDRFLPVTSFGNEPFWVTVAKALFVFDLSIPGAVAPYEAALMLAVAYGIIYFLPNSVELMRRWRPGLPTYENPTLAVRWLLPAWRPTWPWALFAGGLMIWGLYYVARQPPFLYQGF